LFHEEQHFMKFPRIVAQLGDDELRAGGDFLFSVCNTGSFCSASVALKGETTAPGKKSPGWMGGRCL